MCKELEENEALDEMVGMIEVIRKYQKKRR
jgi:hypothetical protein